MLKKICVLVLFILVSSINVQKSYAEEQLTLNESVKAALENNNELRAMKSSLSAQEKDIGIARSNLLPKVKLEESFASTNQPAQAFALKLNQERFSSADLAGAPDSFNNPGIINNFLTSVSLEQPVFAPKASIGLNMAKRAYSAQGYDYLRKQEEVISHVALTYLIISTAQEYLGVSQKAIDDAKEHLRISQLKYKNGLGLYSDILRAKTALTEAEQNLITANKNYNVAKRALGLLLGKKESVGISSNLPVITLNNPDYYNNASIQRNDIKALELKAKNAGYNVKMAKTDYYPTIGVGASYNLFDHRAPFALEGNNYVAAAFLKWDAFDGNKRKYEVAKAKDQVSEVKEYLEGLKKAVSYKVYESYLNVEEAQKNLELTSSALKTAEEGKRLVLKRYENGLAPFVDLLDAQMNLEKARVNVIKNQNDYLTSLIKLSYESGVLFKDLGIE